MNGTTYQKTISNVVTITNGLINGNITDWGSIFFGCTTGKYAGQPAMPAIWAQGNDGWYARIYKFNNGKFTPYYSKTPCLGSYWPEFVIRDANNYPIEYVPNGTYYLLPEIELEEEPPPEIVVFPLTVPDTFDVESGDIYICPPANNNLNNYIMSVNKALACLPSVLNGKTVYINLTNMPTNSNDTEIANREIITPIMIHKFYQGTIKVVSDKSTHFNWKSVNTPEINLNLYNLLTDEFLSEEKGRLNSLPLIYVKDVDNIIFHKLDIALHEGATWKSNANPSIGSGISPMILLNNVKSAKFHICNFSTRLQYFYKYIPNYIYKCISLPMFNTENYFFETAIYSIASKVQVLGCNFYNVPVMTTNNFSETFMDNIFVNFNCFDSLNLAERAWSAININNSIFSLRRSFTKSKW